MASSYFPAALSVSSLGINVEMLKKLWERPVTLGTVVLAGAAAATVTFVLRDIWLYYGHLRLEMRGTQSSDPSLYIFSGIIRLVRWLRGADGTSSAPIRRFVRRSPQDVHRLTFLDPGELAERRGPRPGLNHLGLPQRQVPQMLDPTLREALHAFYRDFQAAHPELTLEDSHIEPNAFALFVPDPVKGVKPAHPDLARVPPTSVFSVFEFAHVHDGDNSLHLNLAPLDAALAIDKGWATRFPLAGAKGPIWQPEGRVLVYAPRDESEVEVAKRLTEASWEYMNAKSRA